MPVASFSMEKLSCKNWVLIYATNFSLGVRRGGGWIAKLCQADPTAPTIIKLQSKAHPFSHFDSWEWWTTDLGQKKILPVLYTQLKISLLVHFLQNFIPLQKTSKNLYSSFIQTVCKYWTFEYQTNLNNRYLEDRILNYSDHHWVKKKSVLHISHKWKAWLYKYCIYRRNPSQDSSVGSISSW